MANMATMASSSATGSRTAAPTDSITAQAARARANTVPVPNRSQSAPPMAFEDAPNTRPAESRRPNPAEERWRARSTLTASTAQPPQNTPNSKKTQPMGRRFTVPL